MLRSPRGVRGLRTLNPVGLDWGLAGEGGGDRLVHGCGALDRTSARQRHTKGLELACLHSSRGGWLSLTS